MMNQRIKELLVQSGLLDYTKIIVPEYEKFAELIVKDAIDGLLDAYGPDDCLPQEEIAGFLKERFGV